MSDDIMLLGVLRMPWDTRDDLTLMQVQDRCLQAADKIEALEREIANLRSENEALRKDAERYRFIRIPQKHYELMVLYRWQTPEAFDAAIDAARKESHGT